MATIGRAAAVADLKGIHLTGLTAWLLWLFIHLMYLASAFATGGSSSYSGCGTIALTGGVCGSSSDMTSGNARHALELLPRKLSVSKDGASY